MLPQLQQSIRCSFSRTLAAPDSLSSGFSVLLSASHSLEGLVWTVLGERVVQKHRIETLNKNRDALEKE